MSDSNLGWGILCPVPDLLYLPITKDENGGKTMKGVEEKTFDLTIGRVRQTLIQYALPLVVMNLMQSLYSMADLLISGHFIGSRGISGINNSSQVMLLVTQIAIGLSQGGNILIGQFFGAREENARKETTNTLFYSFMILSLATAILLRTFASSMLKARGIPGLYFLVLLLTVFWSGWCW